MISFLRLSFLPANADLGLLVLRLVSGGSMLWLHGKAKLMDYQKLSETFHPIIVNSKISLALTVFAEVVCAGLLILGLFGRSAALVLAITMGVAFFMTHKMVLIGPKNGELALMYLMAFFALFLSGPGKFSIDGNTAGGAA